MSKVLARNPLSQSIFTKTTDRPLEDLPPRNQQPETGHQTPLSVYQENTRTGGDLTARPSEPQVPAAVATRAPLVLAEQTEKVTCKLSVEINDWLDGLLRTGRRKHGSKIPKETWIQAALELFRSQSQDWSDIATVEQLQERLALLVSGNR